jgi:acyl carrier protein
MTRDEVRRAIIDALTRVAPEVDPGSIPPGASLRDEFDLDSMDFLNFAVGLHERLGIDIPERDYPRLATLEGAEAYLTEKTVSGTTR